ncbi:uncharacterized protein LOC101845584 [Aplysia californica]|uniref:Kinase n=1 Tax=Aplysia californica TaxID=6500 RepID=A0ABM0K7S6_APLCA|nr:uncharacterized protein LOC101845584 [Aplysia californica]XP_005110805.1 uncharacterized protein LOC101845584 [Aplysia californica]
MQWQPAPGKQLLAPFGHQVAGQSSMLWYDSSTVCKPLIAREHFVYRTLPPALAEFTPEYRGEIEVQLQEDNGYIQLYGVSVTSQDEHGSPPCPCFTDPEDDAECKGHCCPDATPPGRPADSSSPSEGDGHDKDRSCVIRVLSSGSYEVCPSTEEMFYTKTSSPQHPSTQSLNPWSLKNHKRLLDKMRKSEHSHNRVRFILLKNVVAGFDHPCILDLKIGSRLHADDASNKKVASQSRKCRETTSSSLGVRLCGMQVYQTSSGIYKNYDKFHGRTLTDASFKAMLYEFLHNGQRFRSELLRPIIRRLSQLISCLGDLSSYRFYASSLLIIYDGNVNDNDTFCDSVENSQGLNNVNNHDVIRSSSHGMNAKNKSQSTHDGKDFSSISDFNLNLEESSENQFSVSESRKHEWSHDGISFSHYDTLKSHNNTSPPRVNISPSQDAQISLSGLPPKVRCPENGSKMSALSSGFYKCALSNSSSPSESSQKTLCSSRSCRNSSAQTHTHEHPLPSTQKAADIHSHSSAAQEERHQKLSDLTHKGSGVVTTEPSQTGVNPESQSYNLSSSLVESCTYVVNSGDDHASRGKKRSDICCTDQINNRSSWEGNRGHVVTKSDSPSELHGASPGIASHSTNSGWSQRKPSEKLAAHYDDGAPRLTPKHIQSCVQHPNKTLRTGQHTKMPSQRDTPSSPNGCSPSVCPKQGSRVSPSEETHQNLHTQPEAEGDAAFLPRHTHTFYPGDVQNSNTKVPTRVNDSQSSRVQDAFRRGESCLIPTTANNGVDCDVVHEQNLVSPSSPVRTPIHNVNTHDTKITYTANLPSDNEKLMDKKGKLKECDKECDKDEERFSSSGSVLMDVRMIDFAHTTHRGFVQDKCKHTGPDRDYVNGLKNLVRLFLELEAEN